MVDAEERRSVPGSKKKGPTATGGGSSSVFGERKKKKAMIDVEERRSPSGSMKKWPTAADGGSSSSFRTPITCFHDNLGAEERRSPLGSNKKGPTEAGGDLVLRQRNKLSRISTADEFRALVVFHQRGLADRNRKSLGSSDNSSIPDTDAPDDAFIPKHFAKLLKDMEENHARDLVDTYLEVAQAALNYYNLHHGTDYELVKIVGGCYSFEIGTWYHLNFKARPSRCGLPCADCSTKLFFTECAEFSCLEIKACCIVDQDDSRSQIVAGCEFCFADIIHPTGGFQAGCTPTS